MAAPITRGRGSAERGSPASVIKGKAPKYHQPDARSARVARSQPSSRNSPRDCVLAGFGGTTLLSGSDVRITFAGPIHLRLANPCYTVEGNCQKKRRRIRCLVPHRVDVADALARGGILRA